MSKTKSITLWVAAFILMAAASIYQERTGPTYPKKGEVEINGKKIHFSLPRTHGGDGGEMVRIYVPDNSINGIIVYKRYKSDDSLTTTQMSKAADTLSFELPHQPMAGKIQYQIFLTSGSNKLSLTDDPVLIRFKGDVPAFWLILHILFMFSALVFSTRTGLEAIYKGDKIKSLSILTVILLFVGAAIMGPMIQKFAFDAYWTGWPFGHDLTDNKAFAALLFWAISLWRIWKNPQARVWAIIASIVMIVVYLIPHSMLGSELDYRKMTGQ